MSYQSIAPPSTSPCRGRDHITVVHGTLDTTSDPGGYAAVRERGPSVVAIGKFDGIHRGHRALLSRVLVEARRLGCQAGVVTFDAHPSEVLRGAQHAYLTTLPEREGLCAEIGVDFMLLLRSTPALFETEAQEFAAALIKALNTRVIVVGADFRFGRAAKGDVSMLQALAHRHGVKVISVELNEQLGSKVSSTRVREELVAGRVEQAAHLLGRPFSVEGTVKDGTTRTWSVEVPARLAMPAPGVYLGRVVFPAAKRAAGPVVIKVADATGEHRRIRLLRLGNSPHRAKAGMACSIVFERSGPGSPGGFAVKRTAVLAP